MQLYGNVSGNSGVKAFEIGSDFIRVRFYEGTIYLYTYASCGRWKVEMMKGLARSGKGLSGFMSTAYASRS